MSPVISVVIPAHNEEAYLGATLDALRRQTYPLFEVMVVANACLDHTEEVARRRCDRFIGLEERGLSRARNIGGNKARGDILVFLDADTLLDPQALEVIAAEFTCRHAAGSVKGAPDTRKIGHRALYFLKNLVHQLGLHRGSSGVIICWREHFKRVGGFDQNLHVCENSDLIRKLCRFGKYKFIARTTAVTSMRRYNQHGLMRMCGLWVKLWFISLFSDLRHRQYDAVR